MLLATVCGLRGNAVFQCCAEFAVLYSAVCHVTHSWPFALHSWSCCYPPSLLELIILLFVCFSREYNYIQMVVKLYFSGVQNILLCIGKSTGHLNSYEGDLSLSVYSGHTYTFILLSVLIFSTSQYFGPQHPQCVYKWNTHVLFSLCSNGTSMISLIIPPKDQISRVAKMLADEFGTASNIKSRVNRLSVLGAITSVQQRLKLYNKGKC